MKTIPLKTLLGQITSLPWKMHETGSIVPSDYNSDGAYLYGRETSRINTNYIVHCCNHFPELVEAAKQFREDFMDKTKCRPGGMAEAMNRLNAALASAETVQIED